MHVTLFQKSSSSPLCRLIPSLICLLSLSGCGEAFNSGQGTSATESASELALYTVNGAIDSQNTNGSIASLEKGEKEEKGAGSRFFAVLESLFSLNSAWAAPLCTTLGQALDNGSCSNGVVSLLLNGCSFLKGDEVTFYGSTWNGVMNYSFTHLNQHPATAYCPAYPPATNTSFPQSSSGGSIISGSGLAMTRTMVDLIKTSADGKTVVTVDTSTPSGWDSTQGKKSGGIRTTFTTISHRKIDILGVHYLASRSSTSDSGVATNSKIWDYTVSTTSALSSTYSYDATNAETHLTTGTVIVQNNLSNYTAKSTLSALKHSRKACGCIPVSGTITTFFTGNSPNGITSETLTITGCGTATLATNLSGSPTAVTLTQCQ